MNFKAFFDDTDAVSPVIGVILMVAITVILAAVIGTFVLGLGDQVQTTAPSHNFNTEASGPNVTFASTGGQSVNAGNLAFQFDASHTVYNVTDGNHSISRSSSPTWASVANVSEDTSVSAGASVTFMNGTAGKPWTEGDTITLVWQDQGQSSTLTTYTAD